MCVSRLLLVVPRLASHVSWGFFVFPVSYGAYATRLVSIVGTVSSPLACSRCLFRGVWARFRISRLFSGWFVSSVACVVISLVCELTVLLFRSSAALRSLRFISALALGSSRLSRDVRDEPSMTKSSLSLRARGCRGRREFTPR